MSCSICFTLIKVDYERWTDMLAVHAKHYQRNEIRAPIDHECTLEGVSSDICTQCYTGILVKLTEEDDTVIRTCSFCLCQYEVYSWMINDLLAIGI